MHIQASDGTYLHVKDMGVGQPVILIHGWPLSGDMFEYQTLALLEAGYRVITYDRRGFGLSGHPANGYHYDRFADDLADIIVERAALIGAVVPYLARDESNPDGVEASVFEEMKEKIREDRFDFLQSFAKQFYGIGLMKHPVSDALLDWTFALAIMASPKATIDCVTAFGYEDFRLDLPAFTVPTLIIHGTSDTIVPIDASARIAAINIPTSQLIEYSGAPHGLFATEPQRLNEDLLAFLAEGGKAGSSAADPDVEMVGSNPVALYP